MKKLLLLSLLCILLNVLNAQVFYYKGEWTKSKKHDLFSGIFEITIKGNGFVTGKFLWPYRATDSADNLMTTHYKGKKGRTGIEYVEGTFDAATNDFYFEGIKKDDPDDILGWINIP
jgi:hypothetical protein